MKQGRRKSPTLKDVAERAGVTGQTVSNYMTGRYTPRGDNLERIERAIRDLNYRPSAAARALRLQESNVLGLLLEDASDDSATANANGYGWEPLHALFLQGATVKARELGFYVTTVLTSQGETENHASKLVREGRADGLICSAGLMTPERLKRLQKVAQGNRVPVVLLQETVSLPGICSVSAEDEIGAALAAAHLAELGHRHVAVVMVEPLWPGPMRRTNGFTTAARKAGLAVEEWVAERYTIDAIRGRIRTELDRSDRPTAIFAVNDVTAIAVIQQANELGLSVPADLSVVGFNNLDIATYFRPALTTVSTPAIEMGARATEIIVAAVRGAALQRSAALPVRFIVRDSTARPPKPVAKRRR